MSLAAEGEPEAPECPEVARQPPPPPTSLPRRPGRRGARAGLPSLGPAQSLRLPAKEKSQPFLASSSAHGPSPRRGQEVQWGLGIQTAARVPSAAYNWQPQAVLGTCLVFLDQCFVCLHGPNTVQSENVTKNSDLSSSSIEKVEYLTKLDPLCCIARLWVLGAACSCPVPTWSWALATVPTTPRCLRQHISLT